MFIWLTIIFFAFLISFLISILGNFFTKKNKFYISNSSPFECGINSTFNFSSPMSLRFFVLAVIFLIFDVELILLFPVTFIYLKFFFLINITYFITLLGIITWGLLWEWNQSLLTWST